MNLIEGILYRQQTSQADRPADLIPLNHYLFNFPQEDLQHRIISSSFLNEKKFNNLNPIKFLDKISSLEKLEQKFNYITIDSPVLDERRDRFISREIERWLRERESQRRQAPMVRPQIPEPTASPDRVHNSYFSSRTGVSAHVVEYINGQSLMVNGQPVLIEGGRYAEIDFTPGGRFNFDPRLMTDSLMRGIQGTMEFLEAIDQGRFEAVSVLKGTTNIHMALIAQRLGFEIVDDCRTPNGKIDKGLQRFTVVGRFDDIRRRAIELSQAHLPRLVQRNQRLQLSAAVVG